MTVLAYVACVVVAIVALLRVLKACIENDGAGETECYGDSLMLLFRLVIESAVLFCAWRAWP